MKLNSGDKGFEVYRLKSENDLLVAIPVQYILFIQSALEEFGTIEDIPSDRTVRGIFLKNVSGAFELHGRDQQNDIIVNQIILE